MLRLSTRAALRSPIQHNVRFSHHVAYGPAEPLGWYVKWVAGLSVAIGAVAYDRVYTDRAITKWITPATNKTEIDRQRERYADLQIRDQDRAITILAPKERSQMENLSPHPVPEGSWRATHSGSVLDTSKIGERRPRKDVLP